MSLHFQIHTPCIDTSPRLGANPKLCFEKYVDAVIDLLIPGQTPGIKEKLVDLYGKPELLFFGPDEGTADLMDWAASESMNSA